MDSILGFVRHVLTFGGGFLVANGAVTDADAQAIIGALVTLIGVAWSIWQKRQAATAR